jgi:hypothetical protein
LSECSNSCTWSSGSCIMSSTWSSLFMRFFQLSFFELLNFLFGNENLISILFFWREYSNIFFEFIFYVLHCLSYFIQCLFVFFLNSLRYLFVFLNSFSCLFVSSLILLITLKIIFNSFLNFNFLSPLWNCSLLEELCCLCFTFFVFLYLDLNIW